MNVQLHQFKLFADLQGQLEAVTPEQIASLSPGVPMDDGVSVVGTMPDHLKSLLCLRDAAIMATKKSVNDFRRAKSGEREQLRAAAGLLNKKGADLNDLFWQALKAEFPSLAAQPRVGYGPLFEVYHQEESDDDSSSTEMILLKSLLAAALSR
jgi:hypothetical protein